MNGVRTTETGIFVVHGLVTSLEGKRFVRLVRVR